jgi:3-deoxy-D-manno-octulosonic-acid transferase
MLWLYNMLLPIARLALRLAAHRHSKIRDGLAGRQRAEAQLIERARTSSRPIVWLHSASVGEYEQARPIAHGLRQERPDTHILHTFFSPSGFEYAKRLGEADWIEYLPEDTVGRMARVLDAVQPAVLVFVKFDVWPNLVLQAAARRIPMLLLDATLHAGSHRNRWPVRHLYAALYRRFEVISAVTEADAARFRSVVPEHGGIVVDGDTRFDQVARRRQAAARVALPAWITNQERPFTFLVGSSWEPDEAIVVAAWQQLRQPQPASSPARMILVPHEPTEAHLQPLEAVLQRHGLTWTRMSQLPSAALPTSATVVDDEVIVDVLLVDRVGVLAEMYAHADCAYIGGAFTTGVHNVMEPAIAGLPLWFGPRHGNAPEAGHLLEAGVAAVVRSAAELAAMIQTLWQEPQTRQDKGERARAYVEANLGASQRCVQRILAALPQPVRREEHS